MDNKLEALKLEAWVRNVMRIQKCDPAEACDYLARIFFDIRGGEFINEGSDRCTWIVERLDGSSYAVKVFRDPDQPHGIRIEGENAGSLTMLYGIYDKITG